MSVTDFADGERWVQHARHPGSVLRQTRDGYFHNGKELSVRTLTESTSEGIRLLVSLSKSWKSPAAPAVPSEPPASAAVVDAGTGEVIPHTLSGFMVGQRKTDGYINATAMCKAAGKLFGHYSSNAATKAFTDELSSVIGIPITDLIVVNQGGRPEAQGTWVHPDVAIHLAQWCSPKFAVQVSRWVREWMTSGTAPVFRLPQTYAEALRALADSEEQKARLEGSLQEEEQKSQRLSLACTEAEHTSTALSHNMAEMDKAVLLTDWLKQTKSIHGHGAIIGRKLLAFKGLLNKAIVKGQRKPVSCINTVAMCQAAGKRYNDCSRQSSKLTILEELASETGIPVSLLVTVIHHSLASVRLLQEFR